MNEISAITMALYNIEQQKEIVNIEPKKIIHSLWQDLGE
jgi:hypothetical protein